MIINKEKILYRPAAMIPKSLQKNNSINCFYDIIQKIKAIITALSYIQVRLNGRFYPTLQIAQLLHRISHSLSSRSFGPDMRIFGLVLPRWRAQRQWIVAEFLLLIIIPFSFSLIKIIANHCLHRISRYVVLRFIILILNWRL